MRGRGSSGIGAIIAGLSTAARNARLLWWLLGANMALAVVAVWPLLRAFEKTLEYHEASAQLAERLDMPWWVDVTTSQAAAFQKTIELVGVVGFLSAILGCFFAGGLIEAYHDTLAGRPMDRFMTSCRRWFVRFAWLFALSLPLYWLVHRLINTHLALALEDVLEGVNDERTGLVLTLGKTLLFLVLFDLVTLVVDYGRVHAVVRVNRSMLTSLREGMLFVLRHPIRVGTLEVLTLILQVAALASFIPVDELFGRTTLGSLIAGVIAGQSFLLMRLFIRESSRAGQVFLFRSFESQFPV